MTEHTLVRLQVQRPHGVVGIMNRALGRAGRAAQVLACMCQRRRQRLALARLDPRLLDDIGVSAEAARREAAKPPWRA